MWQGSVINCNHYRFLEYAGCQKNAASFVFCHNLFICLVASTLCSLLLKTFWRAKRAHIYTVSFFLFLFLLLFCKVYHERRLMGKETSLSNCMSQAILFGGTHLWTTSNLIKGGQQWSNHCISFFFTFKNAPITASPSGLFAAALKLGYFVL